MDLTKKSCWVLSLETHATAVDWDFIYLFIYLFILVGKGGTYAFFWFG